MVKPYSIIIYPYPRQSRLHNSIMYYCPAGYITGESLRNGTSLQYAK